MGLWVMEIPNRTLSPLVPPGIKGEGQGKRERQDDKCGQGLSTSLKVPWGCSAALVYLSSSQA